MVDKPTYLAVDAHDEAAQWPIPSANGEASGTGYFYVIEPADDTLNIDRRGLVHPRS
jgi:hypothetical protein